tara:strand:- start:1342 stop:1905 length:564 start_codon:yes stop_codon:yes gene_type:complete
MQVEGKDHPKGVKKIAKELDKAVAMHKSQAKRLRKAGISEEISRGNKPSAMKKKAKLDVALKKLKARKEKHKCTCNEMVSKLRDSDRRTPGRTIDMKQGRDYSVVKDNQLAKREPNKGSALANRGTKNTNVKPPRQSNPYRSGEKDNKNTINTPSKKQINRTAKATGKVVKSALGNLSQGYGQSSFK